MYRTKPLARVFEISHGPESSIPRGSKKGAALKFLGKFGIGPKAGGSLEVGNYNVINSRQNLKKRVADCARAGGMGPSLLTLDFVEIGPVYQTIKEINMERVKQAGLELQE